jgi:acyl-CoA reductase-like NAD-dependent aldehyde dehydrogenase
MQVGITHNNQISSINPATGKVISSYNITDTEQISRIVNSARRIGFENWKRKDILERC